MICCVGDGGEITLSGGANYWKGVANKLASVLAETMVYMDWLTDNILI